MSTTAYFIGGPEDRTVRELEQSYPTYEFPVLGAPGTALGVKHAVSDYDQTVYHKYPVARYYYQGRTRKGIILYEFEGYS